MNNKTEMVTVRLTKDEKTKLKALALSNDKKVSQLLRSVIINAIKFK